MNFIKTPNCPSNKVTHVLIHADIRKDISYTFNKLGIKCISVEKNHNLYESVRLHPDMSFHHVSKSTCICAPSIYKNTNLKLKKLGLNIIKGESVLKDKYPHSIHYNVARVGNFA